MKTIKKGEKIKRVKDDVAEQQIKRGWEYCQKSLWKAIRNQPVKKVEVSETDENLTDKNKRKARKNAKKKRHTKE